MRGLNKLSATRVKTEKSPGRYGDGGGLWLQVTETGTKSWLFRFMRDGVVREMGLGVPSRSLTLASGPRTAGVCSSTALTQLPSATGVGWSSGLSRLSRWTFRQCAEQYVADNRATWKNAKHRAQWDSTLATYAMPILGDLSGGGDRHTARTQGHRTDLEGEAGDGGTGEGAH